MNIRSVRHKGLKRFIERGDESGLPLERAETVRQLVGFLLSIAEIGEVYALVRCRPHRLKGSRAGVWSLEVSGNWRLTFRHDPVENEIFDLRLEDYH